MLTALIIAIYIIGGFVAYKKIESWSHPMYEKIIFSVIWPLVGLLYGIHWLHNKE